MLVGLPGEAGVVWGQKSSNSRAVHDWVVTNLTLSLLRSGAYDDSGSMTP